MVTIFDLTVNRALHLGEFTGVNRDKALDWVPSDSLFAAIVEAWAQLGVDVKDRLKGFFDDETHPPFRLTSAFPRAGQARFYPAPPVLPSGMTVFKDASHKKAKKVRWLSQQVLDALVAGVDPGGQLIQSNSVWLTDAEAAALQTTVGLDDDGGLTLWRYQMVPHVTVDRSTNASNLHYTGRVSFGPDCGLWFGVTGQADWVRQALLYLQDAGLGGLRSTGHGAFICKGKSASPAEDDNLAESGILVEAASGNGLLLARYAPVSPAETRATLQTSSSYYQFVTVGGWYRDANGHPWRRRSLRLIAEGALLPVAQARGRLVDVRPQDGAIPPNPDKVYRSGLAFFIPAGKLAEVGHEIHTDD